MREKSVFDGYWLDEEVGNGSFGTVYKIVKQDETGDYTRALKEIVIPTDAQYQEVLNSMGGDRKKTDHHFEEIWKNTRNEIQILNALTEKGVRNIVFYYENKLIKEENPLRYRIYIMMEYLTSLTRYQSRHIMCVNDVVRLGREMLEALSCCHQNHIIHRDVKEDNIFITEDGTFKLGDFGVSRIVSEGSQAASLKGTMNYIAPEVYLGRGAYDETVDLYSLGIVLYRMLNYSRNPFMPDYPKFYTSDDKDRAQAMRLGGKLPPLPVLAQNPLGEVIRKAISSREQRFQTAVEFENHWNEAAGKLSAEELKQKINDPTGEETIWVRETSLPTCEIREPEEISRQKEVTVGVSPPQQGGSLKSEKFLETVPEERKEKKQKPVAFFFIILFLVVAGGGIFWMAGGKHLLENGDFSGVMVVDATVSVIPYANLSLDMSAEELKELYGESLTAGSKHQYYLELQDKEHGLQTIMILLDDGEESIEQISLGRKAETRQEFLDGIAGFYSSWICVSKEDPYRYQKENTEVMVTYDDGKQMAYITVNRIYE